MIVALLRHLWVISFSEAFEDWLDNYEDMAHYVASG